MEFFIETLPLWMIAAFALVLFSGYPVALLLAGVSVAFAGIGYLLGEFPLIMFYNFPLRMYGTVSHSLIYPAVPMLLFMGIAFEKSGVAENMLLCLQRLLRRLPGRLAIAVVVLGIILGPLPGIVGASVATIALIALPTMMSQRYDPAVATSSVAAAGTLGTIIPPSVLLFFLAVQLRVSMGHLFLAVLVPSLLLALLYIGYYLMRGSPSGPAPDASEPDKSGGLLMGFAYAVRDLFLPVGLVALVLGSIVAGWATPTQSGAVGAVGSLALMLLNRRLTLTRLRDALVDTALMTSMVFFIVLAAGAFSYPFLYFGGNDLIAELLDSTGLGQWGLLLSILALIFVLGFFIDWIEITVIVLPIFIPILRALDFAAYVGQPELVMVWMGVMVALVLQTSFMTPPFGFALFFVRGAAPPGVTMLHIYRGVIPLVAIQLVVLALVLLLPALSLWAPKEVFG